MAVSICEVTKGEVSWQNGFRVYSSRCWRYSLRETFAFAGGSASPSPQGGDAEATSPGWLGISIVDINERVVDHFNLTVDSGVAIARVAGDGPGGTAGL